MRRLRKFWKAILGMGIAGVLVAIYIGYVSASTNVKVTMVDSNPVIEQGANLELQANLTGTDDNSVSGAPLLENVKWTTENAGVVYFLDNSGNKSEGATGSTAKVYADYAGKSRVIATYHSIKYDESNQPVQDIEAATATANVTVPIRYTNIADAYGSTEQTLGQQVYKVGDSISFTTNTGVDNPLVIETSNPGVVEIASSTSSSGTITVVGGGSTKVTVRTKDGSGNTYLEKSFVVNAKVDFTDGAVNSEGNRVVTLDATPYVPFERTLIKSNVKNPSQSGATWQAENTDILTTYDNGEVLGKYAGVTKLTAGIMAKDVSGAQTFLSGTYDDIWVVVPFKWQNSIENMNVADSFQLQTSGRPGELTWATSNNSVLTVDQNGLVTAVGSGTATISVSRPTDVNNQTNKYNEKYNLSITINVIDSFGLSTTSKEINVDESFDLKALTTTDSPITFKVENQAEVGQQVSSDTIVSTVQSEDGKTLTVTGVKSGVVKITAVQNIDGLMKSAECYVYVRTPVGEVTLDPSSMSINRGESSIVQLLFNPSQPYNDKVLWTTSNADVASVEGDSTKATVKGLKGGTATISVITMDGLKVASCDVSVREPVTGLSLNQTSVNSTMAVGSYQLSATVLPEGDGVNRNVSWTSSDESVITVDENGLVKFVAPGYATIICKTLDNSYIATCNFYISVPVESVTLDYTNEIMTMGSKLRITAEVLPLTATNRTVAWSSSNPSVCTVDQNGLVEAVGTGTATILCQSIDGGISAMCNIYVKQPATSVVLNTTETTVRKGAVFWLNATVLPENADNKVIKWSSKDETIATVDADGRVTAVGSGVTTIIALNEDSGLTATCLVTVTQPITGFTLNSSYQEMWVGAKYAIIPQIEPMDADNKKVTYQSSDPAVASVDENGIVTANQGGSCVIIATTDELKLTATVSIDVKEYVSSIEINETYKTMNIGAQGRVYATVKSDTATNRNVIWSSADPGVASVDDNGNISANGYGMTVVTCTAEDGSGVSASLAVRVIEPVQSISVQPDSINLLVGDSQMVYAQVYPDEASVHDVRWESSNEAVATVDGDGEVFGVGVGKAKITAISNDGNEVKGSCSVYVSPVVSISSLKINSKEITMLSGKTRQLTVRITPTNTTESVDWYSTDTSVVVVDGSGRITTVGPGTADVVCVGGISNKEASCTVHSLAISQSSIRLEQYDTFDLYVDGTDKSVSWRTANPRVATVNSSGHVVARMAGTTKITATVDGKTLTCTVRVTNIR